MPLIKSRSQLNEPLLTEENCHEFIFFRDPKTSHCLYGLWFVSCRLQLGYRATQQRKSRRVTALRPRGISAHRKQTRRRPSCASLLTAVCSRYGQKTKPFSR